MTVLTPHTSLQILSEPMIFLKAWLKMFRNYVLVLADINILEGFQGYSTSWYCMNEVTILSQRVLHVNKTSGKWRLFCIVMLKYEHSLAHKTSFSLLSLSSQIACTMHFTDVKRETKMQPRFKTQ